MSRFLHSDVATRGLALGRLTAGVVATLAPVRTARVLGIDTASAKRVSHLTRMFAVRDAALGAGTLAAGRRGRRIWLLAGIASDAGDTIALAAALRSGTVRGPVVGAVLASSAAAATTGVLTLVRRRG